MKTLPAMTGMTPLGISGKASTVAQTKPADRPRYIAKQMKTMKQAERYQNRLYNQYERVMLIAFPRFEEHGQYVWQVIKPL